MQFIHKLMLYKQINKKHARHDMYVTGLQCTVIWPS